MTRCLAVAAFALALSGCVEPNHLAYDFGRSYHQTFTAQADLTRPSAANAAYALEGTEAEKIRLRVEQQTTDVESGKAEIAK